MFAEQVGFRPGSCYTHQIFTVCQLLDARPIVGRRLLFSSAWSKSLTPLAERRNSMLFTANIPERLFNLPRVIHWYTEGRVRGYYKLSSSFRTTNTVLDNEVVENALQVLQCVRLELANVGKPFGLYFSHYLICFECTEHGQPALGRRSKAIAPFVMFCTFIV